MVHRLAIVVMILLLGAAHASAQECQTRALPLDVELASELDASDCYLRTECDECPRGGPGEYWTIAAAPGTVIAITLRRGSMRRGPSPVSTAWRGAGIAAPGESLEWFTVPASGTFPVLLIGRGNEYGSFTLRAWRVTTPLETRVQVTVNGNRVHASWFQPASGSPILEHVIEAGTAPGASDFGVWSMGTAASATAVDVPRGTYYVRVRTRNAHGWGPASADAVFTTSGLSPPPSGLFVNVYGRAVGLTWYGPFEGPHVLHYELLVGSTQGTATLGILPVVAVRQSALGGYALEFPEVAPGIYFLRVRAVTTAGPSEPSNEVAILVF